MDLGSNTRIVSSTTPGLDFTGYHIFPFTKLPFQGVTYYIHQLKPLFQEGYHIFHELNFPFSGV